MQNNNGEAWIMHQDGNASANREPCFIMRRLLIRAMTTLSF